MFQFLPRQPLAILAAIGLISIFKRFIFIQEDFLLIIEGYETVTLYIWNFFLGWIDVYLFKISDWHKHYIILGIIFISAVFRGFSYEDERLITDPLFFLAIFAWPAILCSMIIGLYNERHLTKALSDKKYIREYTRSMSYIQKRSYLTSLKFHAVYLERAFIVAEFLCWALAFILLSYGLFFFKG